MLKNNFKSGFATIIGRTNVGKSTLMNQLVGSKIAITANKIQTTRNNIRGIINSDSYQIILVDTPGYHDPEHQLGQIMNKSIIRALNDVDVIIFVVPANEHIGRNDQLLLEKVLKEQKPTILAISKKDLVSKTELELKEQEWKKIGKFSDIISINSFNSKDIDIVKEKINNYLEFGPLYFPKDTKSDQPQGFQIAEIIREKIINITMKELPHSIAVLINKLEQPTEEDSVFRIWASVIVNHNSQKAIIVGKGGLFIKKIRTNSEWELRKMLGCKVKLELFVKVIPKWRKKPNVLKRIGFSKESY